MGGGVRGGGRRLFNCQRPGQFLGQRESEAHADDVRGVAAAAASVVVVAVVGSAVVVSLARFLDTKKPVDIGAAGPGTRRKKKSGKSGGPKQAGGAFFLCKCNAERERGREGGERRKERTHSLSPNNKTNIVHTHVCVYIVVA